MVSEETVLNPYVIITPKNKLSAYRLWATLPPYRLRSILECKPVYLKKENIKSAQITKSVWTFNVSNDDYDEIVIYAHKDEVQGGFEQTGPLTTPWYKFLRHYLIRSPTVLTILLIMFCIFISSQISSHYKSEDFLQQFPLYQQFPKEFLSMIKSRLVLWTIVLPSTLAPTLVALFSLSGIWKARSGRVQSAIKVESWLMLIVGLAMIYNAQLAKFAKHSDLLFAPLNSPKLEKVLLEQRTEKNQ